MIKSCYNCGVLLDLDWIPKPTFRGDHEKDWAEFEKKYMENGEVFFECPVCKTHLAFDR